MKSPGGPADLPPEAIELRQIRVALTYSQARFAPLVGVRHVNTLARYERGELGVPQAVLALARLLAGRTPETLTVTVTKILRRRKRIRGATKWDVAFVLVRALPAHVTCWHSPEPAPEAWHPEACYGERYEFVALLPPTVRLPQRRTAARSGQGAGREHRRRRLIGCGNNSRSGWGGRTGGTRPAHGMSDGSRLCVGMGRPNRRPHTRPRPGGRVCGPTACQRPTGRMKQHHRRRNRNVP